MISRKGFIECGRRRPVRTARIGTPCRALVQLVQCLDPGQRGLISFKDFAAGVMALLGASNGHAVEVDGISRKNGFYCSDFVCSARGPLCERTPRFLLSPIVVVSLIDRQRRDCDDAPNGGGGRGGSHCFRSKRDLSPSPSYAPRWEMDAVSCDAPGPRLEQPAGLCDGDRKRGFELSRRLSI
ncbi:hypothetical protein MTO96_033539 [Rhipicephalus appendiculatus]